MDAAHQKSPTDQLREGDEEASRILVDTIATRVLATIRSRFGDGYGWLSTESVVSSAVRTLIRQIKAGDSAPLRLETWSQVVGWMTQVAINKYHDSLKKYEREKKAARITGATEDAREANRQREEAMRQSIDQANTIFDLLTNDEERLVFKCKLDQKNEENIAAALAEKTGEAWTRYMVREVWREIKTRAKRRLGDAFLDD